MVGAGCRRPLRVLAGDARADDGPPLPPPNWISRTQNEAALGTDELNRRTVEHYRHASFEAVLGDFEFTADLVRRIVAEMKEENLMLPAGEPWAEGTLVWEAILGESHGHWLQHADELEAALGRGPARV